MDLVIGAVLEAHVRADALDGRGRPSPEALDPLARLASGQFAGIHGVFRLP